MFWFVHIVIMYTFFLELILLNESLTSKRNYNSKVNYQVNYDCYDWLLVMSKKFYDYLNIIGFNETRDICDDWF